MKIISKSLIIFVAGALIGVIIASLYWRNELLKEHANGLANRLVANLSAAEDYRHETFNNQIESRLDG